MACKESIQFCPECNALLDMTEKLCGALPINDLYPGLITERVINVDDVEEISSEKTRKKRVEQFIVKHLHPELSERETKRFQGFMSVMKRSEKCDFLVKQMEERIKHHHDQSAAVLQRTQEVNSPIRPNQGPSRRLIPRSRNAHMKRYKSDSAVNQAKISKHRSTTKATQYEAAANKFYKIIIILFLLMVTIALIYIVILLKIEIIPAILQLKYNNNDVNNNDTELTLPQIIQENKQVDIASPVLDSWIAHLNISYNDTAPIILKIPNFAEKVNNNDIWYSKPFFAFERGYQMVLGLDAAGSHRGHGSHMSVYIFLSKGPYDDELEQSGHWPIIGSFLIELLNQHNDSLHHSKIIWFAKLCSHCSNRVLNATKIVGYGHDRFISLEVLKNKTLYHENDNVYFRVSFSTCRSCVLLMDSINTIGALVLLSALDICAIIVLLVCVEVYKSLKETSKLVFGLQLNHAMVSNAVFKETCRFYVLVAIAGVVENLPFVLWELTDFISSDVASILED